MPELRVLMIEDSENEALLILRELKRSPYTVIHERVDSAEKLRAALQSGRWDVILSDYVLPGLSGLQALKQVQTSGLDIPIIMISGTVSEEIAVEIMRAGAKDFLSKDKLARLLPAIERELHEARQRQLHRRAQERTIALQSLVAALSGAATPREIATIILKKGQQEFGNAAGVIGMIQPDGVALELLDTIGIEKEVARTYHIMPLTLSAPITDAARTGQIIQIDTMEDYLHLYPDFRLVIQQNRSQSMIALPLIANQQVIGAISMSFQNSHALHPEDREFLVALAHHCAQALERAQLYTAEHQARERAENAQRRLAYLAESSAVLSSTLDFDETLEKLCHLLVPYIADACQISLLHDDNTIKGQMIYHSDPKKEKLLHEIQERYPDFLEQSHGAGYVIRTRETEFVPGVTPEILQAYAVNEGHLALLEELNLCSYIVLPLTAHQKTFGALAVAITDGERHFNDDDRILVQESARRAAIAIYNAQLYAEAQQVAVLEERNRLASDLHDAVTQVLFSSSIISESLLRLQEKNPERARDNIAQLRRLNRGALAEMRNLLLELKPNGLEEASIESLLTELAHAAMGRHPVEITVQINGKQSPPPEVQLVFYRITQEALSNIVKHAEATSAQVSYAGMDDHFTLSVKDNGSGFDAANPRRTVGLKEMHQQAKSVGALFDLNSRPGLGTVITVAWAGEQVD